MDEQGTKPPTDVSQMTDDEYNAAVRKSAQPAGETPQPHPVQTFWDKLKSGVPGHQGILGRSKEVLRSIPRGVADAVVGGVQTISEGAAAIDRKTGLGEAISPGFNQAYDVSGGAKGTAQSFVDPANKLTDQTFGAKSDDPLASFAEGATNFITGFEALGGLKLAQGANAFRAGRAIVKGGKAAKAGLALVKGAAVDATLIDPYEAQLAELVSKVPNQYAHAFGDFMSVKGDDGPAVARLKRATAGAIPGLLVDGIVAGIQKLKGVKTVASSTATEAEKAVAHETIAKSDETIQSINEGTHVPEGDHVTVKPTEDGNFTIEKIGDTSLASAGADPVSALDGVKGTDSPVFHDHAEALQQAETMNFALDQHENVGKVNEPAVATIEEAASTGKLADVVENPPDLGVSYHNTTEEHLDLVKTLSERIIKKQREHVMQDGEVHDPDALANAKAHIEMIPADQMHPTMLGLLKANPESQSVVADMAKMYMGSMEQNLIRLHDIVDARPHDMVAADELVAAVNGRNELRHAIYGGEADAGRRIRGVQKSDAMRKEGYTPAKVGSELPPDMPKEHVAAVAETKAVATEVKKAVSEVEGAVNKTDTISVSAADVQLARAKKTVEAATKKLAKGDIAFTHDEALARARAEEIIKDADTRRATGASLTPEEEQLVSDAAQVKTSTVNPIESLATILTQAEKNFDAALEKAGLPPREKVVTPVSEALDASEANLNRFKDEGAAKQRAFDAVLAKSNRNPDPKAKNVVDGLMPPEGSGGVQKVAPLDGLESSPESLLGKTDAVVEKLKTMKRSENPRPGEVAGMEARDASAVAVSRANAKLEARMSKLSGGNPRDADAIVQAAKVLQHGGTGKAALEVFTNFLLSGPKTWATVLTSGQVLTVFEPVSRMIGGALSGNPAQVREAADILYGAYAYMGDNVKIAAAAMREGRSIINPAPTTFAIGGLTGKVIRAPGNIMLGLDEFTRVSNYRAHIRAKSLRVGRELGLEGNALAGHVDADLRAAFDAQTGIATIPQSLKYADVPTLSGPLAKGSFGSELNKFTNNAIAAKFIVPFVRSSTNIFNYTWESLPGLNRLNANAREVMKAGGEEAAALQGRVALTTSIVGYSFLQATQGNLTGRGPSDPELRKLWLKDNQPYSVKVGGTWVDYQRLDPVATTLGLVADFHTFFKELGDKHSDTEDMLYAVMASVTSNMASKTFMKGLTSFSEAWGGGNPKSLAKWSQGFVANMAVPSGLNAANPDPYFREVRSMADAILNRTPGFSLGDTQIGSARLDPRHNIFGEKTLKTDGVLNRGFNPMTVRDATTSKPEEALVSLGKALHPFPDKMLNGMVDLHDTKTYDNGTGKSPYVRMMELVSNPPNGKPPLRDAMEALVTSDKWKEASDGTDDFKGGKRLILAQVLKEKYESVAQREMMKEFPKLKQHLQEVTHAQGAAIRHGQEGVAAVEKKFGMPVRR